MKKTLKTSGPVRAYLIQALLKEGKYIFRSQDVCSILEKNQNAAADLLAEMVKRQIIFRIKPGLFLIIPLESDGRYVGNWHVAAREMMGSHPYYIGYYSAMAVHGMTTHPVKDVFIVSSIRRNNRNVSGVSFLFQYINSKKVFGIASHWLTTNEQVRVSDLERTVIDGLARPELCGGVGEVAKGMCLKQQEINWKCCVDYAVRFDVYAVAKRLGFLMEELGFGSTKEIQQLKKFTDRSQAYIGLDPTIDEGKDRFQSRWKVRINFNIEEIRKSLET